MLHPASGWKDSRIIIFPQGSPLEQIQTVRLTLPIFPKSAPIQNLFNAAVILCQPPASLPTCLCRDPTGCESQGVVGKQLQMNFGFWMKELDNNCSSLSEENMEKPDPNLPILSWQCDLASVTAICVFTFLRHQTKPGCAHLPAEVWGCRVD